MVVGKTLSIFNVLEIRILINLYARELKCIFSLVPFSGTYIRYFFPQNFLQIAFIILLCFASISPKQKSTATQFPYGYLPYRHGKFTAKLPDFSESRKHLAPPRKTNNWNFENIYSIYLQRLPISLLFLQLFALSNALKILYLVPFPAPSHWFWLKNFSEELLKRGHHVSQKQKRKKINHFNQFIFFILGYRNHKFQTFWSTFKLYRNHYRSTI